MAFPEARRIPSPVALCQAACRIAEVIISGGCRDFLVPVVVPHGTGTPSWSLISQPALSRPPHPPFAIPLSPPPCYFLFTQSTISLPLEEELLSLAKLLKNTLSEEKCGAFFVKGADVKGDSAASSQLSIRRS